MLAWPASSVWGAARTPPPPAIQPAPLTAADQEASRLEIDLIRYKDSSPEAAEILVRLVDLYHANGRVFGLIRTSQKFLTVHAADKRHKAVMLKLIDALESLSRNQDLAAACRQFLERYPQEPESAGIEVRLARTLERMPERLRTATAWRAVWQRQPGTPVGRQAGMRAIVLCESLRAGEAVQVAADLADDMLGKLPPGPLVGEVGYRVFGLLCAVNQPAKANGLAAKMLAKGGITNQRLLRDVHQRMSQNYQALGQFANAVESLRKAVAIEATPEAMSALIVLLNEARATPAEVAAAVNQYVQKFPEREDRYERQAYVARAHERANDKAKALAAYKALLPLDPAALEAARRVVHLNGDEPPKLAETEQLLLDAIQKCPHRADYVTYVLATEVYDPRMKDRAKARQVLRTRLLKAKSDDQYAAMSAHWLLLTTTDEAEFRADVDRFAALRRERPDKLGRCDYLGGAVAGLRNDPKKVALANYLAGAIKQLQADPVLGLWFSQRSCGGKEADEAVWAAMLEPVMRDRFPKPLLVLAATQQAEALRYVPARRGQRLAVLTQWFQLTPKEYRAAAALFHAAYEDNKPEPANEALQALLKLPPPTTFDSELCVRLMAVAEREKNPQLGKQVLAWVKKALAAAAQPVFDARVGDSLKALGMEQQALEHWKSGMTLNREEYYAYDCATRVRRQTTGPARMALDRQLAALPTRYCGQYASWLADDHLAARDLNSFEKVLRDLAASEQQRVARSPEVDPQVVYSWVELCRNDKTLPEADWRRILSAIRDLNAGNPSAVAHVLLLDAGDAQKLAPMARLLAYQAAAGMLGNDYSDWDRMLPLAQAQMEKKEYAAASALLAGLLANVANVDESRRDAARALTAQCYAQIGAVGMIIDEKSPLAPLLTAALYLRLGDERLAFESLTAHRVLFAAHRQELPGDLLVFACERLIAAGGEANLNDVEMWLREWLIRNSDSKRFDDALKAQVQLLLARCYFKAQRYDVARAEFTTAINRFPKTPQALEAQFGIGETFVAQKVYDQALAVFERLAQNPDTDVVVRAEFLRGVVAFQRGDVDEARSIFRAVLDRVPSIELADKALFRLSEIYGLEQRYLEQLTLLRTVGRLGRTSKRSHVPGQSLAIVVYDSDLGISRGHNRIPVVVTTEPGGDRELVYLTSAGAGKGLFRADLDTRLGQAAPNNRILELTGRDTVRCDYPEEFRAQFRRVPLSDVQIQVASDAKLEMASTKEFEEKKTTFSEELQKEVQQPQAEADHRVSQARPLNQIKPGNPLYVRVTDPDRDLSNEPDQVIVKVAADSGDQVQAALKETGPHTGVFEGMVKTGELPAGATATDAAISHAPILAIDRDPKTFWQSEPDGRTPKSLTVDMKDLKRVALARLTVPDPANRAPVRGELQGSYDGAFWFRLGGNPPLEHADSIAWSYGKMKRRVYAAGYTRLRDWQQVIDLTQKTKPVEEADVEELTWSLPADAAEGKAPHIVVFHGKLVQPRPGAARIQVVGARTALVIDGRAEIPLGEGARVVDVWLSAGTHDLTVLAATSDQRQTIGATWARATLASAQVTLHPFQATDFDLTRAEAKTAGTPAPEAELNRTDQTWEFRFPPASLRYVRFVVHEYLGDAVAIGHVEVLGEKPEEQFIPSQADVVALAGNQDLEIAGGDKITATYIDEIVPGDSGRARVLTANLTATFFNADVTPIIYDFARAYDGGVNVRPRRVLRIEPGERFIAQIRDYDEDRSNDPDTVPIEIAVNDGKPVTLTAAETQPNSGLFTKEIDTSAKEERDRITVKPGDRIFCRYLDKQNTFPGHAVVRETVLLVNEPTPGRVRVLDTVVKMPPTPSKPTAKTSKPPAASQAVPASKMPPTITYRRPPDGRDVSQVALAGPMTVEVIDPDAAKDAESAVNVTLTTAAGVKLDVRCIVPPNRQGSGNDDALIEGRFVGQVFLQLGGPGSPDLIPLTTGLPRLLGGPVVEEGGPAKTTPSALAATMPTVTRALNVAGKDLIAAVYKDQRRPDGQPVELSAKARLIENGELECTDHAYARPVERLYLGERLYVRVIDPDRDTTDNRDTFPVEITSTSGERETVPLEETLPHTGVFTGSFLLKVAERPTPGNFNPAEPAIEAFFGDTISVKYVDPTALTESGTLELVREVPVVIGTNGTVAAFSKAFGDEKLAVETRFTVAECHFELFKSHKKLERRDEAKADLEAGRAVLRELMEERLEPKHAPRVAYLLGQFAQELGQWDEAINAYQSILRQYGEHPLAPDAQYKLAQCYEEMGDFDLALEAYVTLAATYPKSSLVANVMIRVGDHFYKKEQFDVAAQIGEKFVEKFEGHQHASRMAFRVGQCRYKAGKFTEAGKAFDRFARVFAEDKLCAEALFWAGESYRMARNVRLAYQRYNRCRWDFPASEAAKYARGRLALPEMLSQFEADSKSVQEPNNQ
jgi:TolA-binding protein